MARLIKIIFIAIIAAVAISVVYFFNKPGRDVATENSIAVSASELFDSFVEDENKANNLYLDKAVTVSGSIREVIKNQQSQSIILLQTSDPMFGIACTLKDEVQLPLKPGTQIKLKGICSGFTNDVVLRDCILADH